MAGKRDTRKKGKKWLLTDWPQKDEDANALFEHYSTLDWGRIRYSTYVLETGDGGKPHMQCFLHFQRQVPLSGVKSFIGRTTVHAEQVIDDDAASHYCEKPVQGCSCKHCKKARESGSVLAGPVEVGTRPAYGTTAQAPTDAVAEMVKQGWNDDVIAREAPWALLRYAKGIDKLRKANMMADAKKYRKVEVILLTGAAGTGKSSWAYDTYGVDNVYAPNLEGNKLWFDDYAGESVLLLDDFRGSSTTLGNLLKYMDGRPRQLLQIKGGHLYALWTTVVITSNTEPTDWYNTLHPMWGENQDEKDAFNRRIAYHIDDVKDLWTPEHRSNAFTTRLTKEGWVHPDAVRD